MSAGTDGAARGGGDAAPALRLAGRLSFAGQPDQRVEMRAEAGRWTCLLGPSGVGKSTLLRLFAGLEIGGDFAGEAAAEDGRPLEGRVAWMAQSDLLLPWLSLRGNVALGARLRGDAPDFARADRLIAGIGLEGHAEKPPGELSGGQRQRGALARLLMEDRPVALLDEPFAALDLRLRAEMQELAFRALEGRTVVLVTHDAHEAARLGHRVLLMSETGLAEVPAPAGAPVRAADAPEVLEAQARLTRALREGPASGEGAAA